MSDEPARIVRVTGFTDDLYALDVNGVLWSFESRQYNKMVWIRLPPISLAEAPCTIVDFYVHISIDPWDSLRHALRVLNIDGKLWELRWCTGGDGEYLWDSISLEAR